MSEYILEMKDICKSFYNVKVLDNVSLSVRPGEIHALLGENGAGKSTLMKILTGIYSMDSGKILINGEERHITTPLEARENEISIMHQEISVCPDMTVAENIFMGVFPRKKPFGMLNRAEMNRRAQDVLDRLNNSIKADTVVGKLTIAQQQIVEIAKAISFNSKIIVMDEPTSALTDPEVDGLMDQMRSLKAQGIAIIYISHRMEEIYKICDRLSVLRDGRYIGTREVKDVTNDEVVKMLVGREITQLYDRRHECHSEETVLSVRNLKNRNLKDISFDLKKGEILGFAGLVGAGRTEMSRAIFGIDSLDDGEIIVEGEEKKISSPGRAIENGIGLVPEDRKQHGIMLEKSVAYNLTLPVARTFIKHFRVDGKKELQIVNEYKDALTIKMNSADVLCKNLSGGNQQKVVISKWLAAKPSIMILDEPTRGIDVGAKSEIYKLVNQLAESGISIIMISSELPEVLNLCNRIIVMHEGEITATLDNNDGHVTQEELMHYAMGAKQ